MKRVKQAPAETKKKISEQDETDRLKRQMAEPREENDILKKFQRFQTEERQKRSGSSGNTDENTA